MFLEFFPLPFFTSLLALALVMIRFREEDWCRRTGCTLLGFYLMAVIAVVFFPLHIPENWPANLNWEGTIWNLKKINFIPFYYGSMTYDDSYKMVFQDIVANILLTIPFGFGGRFLKFLYGKRLVFGALVAGLILEGVQLLQKLIFGVSLHSVDINDVIFNALGVIAGGGLFWIAESVFCRARKTG